jgi:hypothetical protein
MAASRFSSPSMTLRERSSSSSVIWNALRCSITLRPFSTSSSTGSDKGNLVAPPLGVVPLERGGGPVGVGRRSGLRPGIIMPEGGRSTYGMLDQPGPVSRAAGLPRGGLSGTWGVAGRRPVMIDSNGAAWLSMVRRGSEWCGVAQYGAAWLSMVRRGSVYGAAWLSC